MKRAVIICLCVVSIFACKETGETKVQGEIQGTKIDSLLMQLDMTMPDYDLINASFDTSKKEDPIDVYLFSARRYMYTDFYRANNNAMLAIGKSVNGNFMQFWMKDSEDVFQGVRRVKRGIAGVLIVAKLYFIAGEYDRSIMMLDELKQMEPLFLNKDSVLTSRYIVAKLKALNHSEGKRKEFDEFYADYYKPDRIIRTDMIDFELDSIKDKQHTAESIKKYRKTADLLKNARSYDSLHVRAMILNELAKELLYDEINEQENKYVPTTDTGRIREACELFCETSILDFRLDINEVGALVNMSYALLLLEKNDEAIHYAIEASKRLTKYGKTDNQKPFLSLLNKLGTVIKDKGITEKLAEDGSPEDVGAIIIAILGEKSVGAELIEAERTKNRLVTVSLILVFALMTIIGVSIFTLKYRKQNLKLKQQEGDLRMKQQELQRNKVELEGKNKALKESRKRAKEAYDTLNEQTGRNREFLVASTKVGLFYLIVNAQDGSFENESRELTKYLNIEKRKGIYKWDDFSESHFGKTFDEIQTQLKKQIVFVWETDTGKNGAKFSIFRYKDKIYGFGIKTHTVKDEEKERLAQHKIEIAKTIAHQLRTPMGIIRNYTGLLQKYYNSPKVSKEKRNEYFEAINNSINRMSGIINMMLELEKLDDIKSVRPRERNIYDFSRQTYESFTSLTDMESHSCTFNAEEACREYTADIDEDVLGQILDVLLSNARKYTPQGKKISFALSCCEDYFTISIKDEGIGIPGNFARSGFKKFQRADNVSTDKGLGIGLFTAEKLIKAHRGMLHLVSEIDKGTEAVITIPKKHESL